MGTGGGLLIIDFSRLGNSAHFRGEGWSGQEDDRVWAVGPCAILRVPMQTSGRSLIVEAEMGPGRMLPEIGGQLVRVVVNGTALGWVRLDARSMIRCEIGAALTREDGILDVAFDFPGYFRPAALRPGEDKRPLAAWFSFVRLYTTDMFKPGPHFPTSGPDIPVVGLSSPFVPLPEMKRTTAPWSLTFDAFGDWAALSRDGWDHGTDGVARMTAASAQIELPAPPTPDPSVIRIDVLTPTVAGPACDVTVTLSNIVIGQFSLDAPTVWTIPLPPELTVGRDSLVLTLLCRRDMASATSPAFGIGRIDIVPLPSALPVADFHRLARDEAAVPRMVSKRFPEQDEAALLAATEAAFGTDVATLARDFESLGLTHDFGEAQRAMGHDLLNFFRSSEGSMPGLLRALRDDLQAASQPDSIAIESGTNGRAVGLSAYDLRWTASDDDEDTDRLSVATRLGYLRRKFFEGLAAGRKIYVVSQSRPTAIGEALALLLELNRHGSAVLLCVEPASADHRAGEVGLLMPGLMRGYVDAADPSAWRRLIANAALARRGDGGP
jgi:hypothetical protein